VGFRVLALSTQFYVNFYVLALSAILLRGFRVLFLSTQCYYVDFHVLALSTERYYVDFYALSTQRYYVDICVLALSTEFLSFIMWIFMFWLCPQFYYVDFHV
jgi:hypothetical protein